MKVSNKFKELIKILGDENSGLIEKETAIKRGILAVIMGENIILVGPPGTAKSEISRRLTQIIKGGVSFEYLLTKFTTPEELFGPISLEELKKDRFIRKTAGYLPTANIGFLDEIFKANSSILNSLLTILNERIYHNGNTPEKTNIVSIIGASNELPTNEEELSALYDRFLFKIEVGYLKERDYPKLFSVKEKKKIEIEEKFKFDIKELEKIREESQNLKLNTEIETTLIKIIREKNKLSIKDEEEKKISDRKIVKIIKLLKLSAYLNEREEVTKEDMRILNDVLWTKTENQKAVQKIVSDAINS